MGLLIFMSCQNLQGLAAKKALDPVYGKEGLMESSGYKLKNESYFPKRSKRKFFTVVHKSKDRIESEVSKDAKYQVYNALSEPWLYCKGTHAVMKCDARSS